MTPAQLKKVKSVFAKHGVRFAYLFGSRVAKEYRMAIYFGDGGQRMWFQKGARLLEKLAPIINIPVHLIILDDLASINYRYRVITFWNLIYKQDEEAWLDYELRTWNEYDDFKPFLFAYGQARAGVR